MHLAAGRLSSISPRTVKYHLCSHKDSIELTELPDEIAGCEDCLAIGGTWMHLRMCQSCGRIGCCNSSLHRHASAHARGTRCIWPTERTTRDTL
jgi:hypothetical protein